MRQVTKYIVCIACLFAATTTVRAESNDVKEIIFAHIGDAYEWHITTWGATHITIPLPVIAYSKEQGWNFFLSSKLHHGAYKGFWIAQEGKNAGKLVMKDATGVEVRPLDISLTKNATALIINSTIVICLIMGLARWYRKRPVRSVPKGFWGALEMFVMNIQDEVIKPCIGPKYKRYAPYLLTLFFFILINNLMGLIPFFPGGASVTGNIAVTMVLALCTFFIVNLSGNRTYWKEIFWPDIPLWLKAPIPLIPIIEFLGVFTKPFALMIRLFANIMAGHVIIITLTCLIFLTLSMGWAVHSGMTLVSVVMSVFMGGIELLVAYLQALVFTMLSAVFIGLALPEPHHNIKIEKLKTV